MNLIHEGGSNDITLYVNGDMSQQLLDRAIAASLQNFWVWNLIVHILPQEFIEHKELFVGWDMSGHIDDNPPIITMRKQIRRSSDGGAAESALTSISEES